MPESVIKHLNKVYAIEIEKPLGHRLMINGVS